MADSNVVGKPLLEKIQDLLGQKEENYVTFCVGKEKKIVKALKVVLKASSQFLKNEFEEKWEVAVVEEGEGIPLSDLDPIAFELFVKFTSLDMWCLESLKALNLPPNQILNLLSICRSFEMKTAEENLKILATIFLQSFSKYKDTDDFMQLSQANLKSVLGSDDIGIRELDVFYAAIRWAEFQCTQMEVLPTKEKFREVLGDCLFEIRFPIMTCAEFTEARNLKDILTAKETIGIYEFIGSTENKNGKKLELDVKNLPFKTTPRNIVQTLESNPNPETNNSETFTALGISRIGSTRGWETAKNHPIVSDDSQKIRWGNKINGFPSRSAHAAVAVGNAIYSFGGWGSDDPPTYSEAVLDVFVLNVNEREKKWKKVSVENSEVNPNQSVSHSAVAHEEFVLIFGGFDLKQRKYLNATYRFNTLTRKWDKPKVTGNVPHARRFHSAVVLRNEMLVYGGSGDKDEVTSDLHSLHLESFCWSTIETKGISPSLSELHSATVHNDRFILIFGGRDCEEKNDVNSIHSFDLRNKTWTAVETRGTPPSSRRSHCAFVHSGRMYIFGGANYCFCLNDVFSYDPETFEWKEVTPNGDVPSPRKSAGCVALNDQVFIFGGDNFHLQEFDDTNVLQM